METLSRHVGLIDQICSLLLPFSPATEQKWNNVNWHAFKDTFYLMLVVLSLHGCLTVRQKAPAPRE